MNLLRKMWQKGCLFLTRTLWTWGTNTDGQMGIGDITNRSSPVQVGALTTWSKISAGEYSSLAISVG